MKINYLENNICKFTPLFEINYLKKKNIIVTSLFKMSKGYKDFDRYLQGIQFASIQIIKLKLPFEFRIFIDITIFKDKNIMKFLKNISNVNLILYHCNSFFSNNFHRGTFGTIVRFFPMFDFKNNDSNIVICIDSDIAYIDFRKIINSFFLMRENNLLDDLTLFNVSTIAKNSIIIDNKIYPYVMAGLLINKLKINKKLITEYLNEIFKFNYTYKNYYTNKKVQETKKVDKKIFYGFDEIFLNNKLLPYLIEKKKKICIYDEYSIIYQFFYIIKNPTYNIEPLIYKKFFEYILQDYNFKYENLQKSFKFLDSILYNKLTNDLKLSDKEYKLCIKIYQFYKDVYNTENSKFFNTNFLTYILQENKLGILYSIKMKVFNYKNKQDIIIKKKIFRKP